MDWNNVTTTVDAVLTQRYGSEWRITPVLSAEVEPLKRQNGELEIDVARNDLRDFGFAMALAQVAIDGLPAAEVAARLWAPKGVEIAPLLPTLESTAARILSADGAIGARAGLDSLIMLVATAHQALQAAHGTSDGDPVELARRWIGIDRLCGAMIARAIASCGHRVTEHFFPWDVLGLRTLDAELDRHGDVTRALTRRDVDYIGVVGTAAMRYLHWQQENQCQCRAGCHREAHDLRRWVPMKSSSGQPAEGRGEGGVVDDPQHGTAELGQWFWALMIGVQPKWLRDALPPLQAKVFEANLFYRDFLLHLPEAQVDLRVEETVPEICAVDDCPSLTADRDKNDRPVPARAWRYIKGARKKSSPVGPTGVRYCRFDRTHPLRYQPRRFRDFVLQSEIGSTHRRFGPLTCDDELSCWVVGGRGRPWVMLPLGDAHQAMLAATEAAGLDASRLSEHPVPWRRQAALAEAEAVAEAEGAIDPRIRALAKEMNERNPGPGDLSFLEYLCRRAQDEGIAAPRRDCPNEECRDLWRPGVAVYPYCRCTFFAEFQAAWLAETAERPAC